MVQERLMTAAELAIYLSCSLSTVRRLVADGALPHYRVGRMVRFRRNEIDSWLQRRRQAEAASRSGGSGEIDPQLSLFGLGDESPS